MAEHDKDIELTISAEVAKEGFDEGQKTVAALGRGASDAMDGVEKTAGSAGAEMAKLGERTVEATRSVGESAQQTAETVEGLEARATSAAQRVADFYAGLEAAEAKRREALNERGPATADPSASPASGGGSIASQLDAARLRRIRAQAQAQQDAGAMAARAKLQEADATDRLAAAERALEEAERRRIEQSKLDVQRAQQQRGKREEKAATTEQQVASRDFPALARGTTYVSAIAASIRSADAMMSEFQQTLAAAGTDLDKLRQTNPADFLWVDAMHALSSPLGFIKEQMLAIAGMDVFKKHAEQVAKNEKAMAAAAVQMERWAQVDDSIRRDNLAAEKNLIDEITSALERQIRVRKAVENAEETLATIADDQSVREGADPNLIRAQQTARRAESEIAALADDTMRAERAAESARAEMDRLDEILRGIDPDTPEGVAAFKAFRDARDKFEALTLDAEAMEQIADAKTIEITAKAGAAIRLASANAGQAVSDVVSDAIGLIDEKIRANGGQASAGMTQALEGLESVLRDNIPDTDQVLRIRTLFMGLASAREAQDGEFQETLRSMTEAVMLSAGTAQKILTEVGVAQRNMDALATQLSAVQTANQSLSAKINQLNSRR